MKLVIRLDEPAELSAYRAEHPMIKWEPMRKDAVGRTVYEVVRQRLLEGQGCLCGFCEVGLHDRDPLKCRVEHFHPKSDRTTAHNWALDWQNMIAVCTGGSQRYQQPPHALEPLRENLSCDAHKDQMIQGGKLDEQCDGWIINPLELPAFPCLFFLEKSTGRLLPDEQVCAGLNIPGNRHPSTQHLVQSTIDMFNLNCNRLCEARLRICRDIERSKKKYRQQNIPPERALHELAERHFRNPWPSFFTTIRLCLGTAAEQHLAEINFQG